MNTDRFWTIVDASRRAVAPGQADGNTRRQAEGLRRQLLELSPEEIVSFRDHFQEQMNAAYRWDLWGVAHLVAGGCSEDGFTDFRSWLISMGRGVFEAALSNPESLLPVVDAPSVEDVFFEEFQYVPARVYESRTGHAPPPRPGVTPSVPAGERWSEADLARRFPAFSSRDARA